MGGWGGGTLSACAGDPDLQPIGSVDPTLNHLKY